MVNQHPQQYQLQYFQPNQQIANSPNSQQTIQHFIQPQQQIQGIIQTTAPIQSQLSTTNTQQIITLQGNTAFMIPPPNIIAPQQSQSIIQTGDINLNPNENPALKEEKDKDDGAVNRIDKNEGNLQVATSRAIITTPMTITPLMSVPPPNIQQIIGNTLISQPPPNQPQTQQIFNQIPVSIHQSQITQSPQIQVSGSHFILNSPWPPNQPPPQQITQINPIGIQGINQSPTIRNTNEIIINNVQNDFQRQQQGQPQIVQTFNPQMQIQFHPPPQIVQPPNNFQMYKPQHQQV